MNDKGAPELQGPLGVFGVEMLEAPWTDEQVGALNAYQRLGNFHPYTCPYTHDWRTRRLVATTEGWTCAHPNCGYTQNWAHDRAARLGRGDVGD